MANAPYNPDVHCGATRVDGGICTRPKGWGTPHPGIGRCKKHGGSTRTHVKSAENERRKGEIGKLIEEIARDSDSDGIGTLQEAVVVARRMMRATDIMVKELDSFLAKTGDDDGWEQHDLVAQLQQWTANAAKIAKLGLDAGVDEREVRLKEEQAELVAQGYRTLVASMQRVLLEAGLERKVIDAVWNEKVPGLVREALVQVTP